ncbi:MAG: hypothetical protein LBD97_05035 [Bifidobacteriaceae bacterium]|jgi:hypothetical protein|nr:hypothetical protein [Bifidobacteriaceae bacterium]
MRFPTWRPALAAAAAAALLFGAGVAGGVHAWWRANTVSPAFELGVGQVYAAVEREPGTANAENSVTSALAEAKLVFKVSDAVTATAQTAGVAIPFDVVLRGAAHTGLDYLFVLPNAVADSVAEASTFTFIRRPPTGCSPTMTAAETFAAKPGDMVGPFEGMIPDAVWSGEVAAGEPVREPWCLVVKTVGGSSYEIVADAVGEAASGIATDSDSWSATLLPDATVGGDYKITLTTMFTRPPTTP